MIGANIAEVAKRTEQELVLVDDIGHTEVYRAKNKNERLDDTVQQGDDEN